MYCIVLYCTVLIVLCCVSPNDEGPLGQVGCLLYAQPGVGLHQHIVHGENRAVTFPDPGHLTTSSSSSSSLQHLPSSSKTK